MIDKICDKLMQRIRGKMPEVDDERAEVIQYGLELLIGEVPKTLIILLIAWILGVFKYTLISFLIILPYRLFSGGLHLKTHIGCIIGTSVFYIGNAYISQLLKFQNFISKLIFSILVLIFAIIMITLYAPADTENVPILRKKDRKLKKIYSYITVLVTVTTSFFFNDSTISNMCIIGVLLQSISISKLIYKIFKVKYGYLEYIKKPKNAI